MKKTQEKVLMLGNGINRLGSDYSWGTLMSDLLAFTGLAGEVVADNKPFPLLYEEILLKHLAAKKNDEMRIKRKIGDLIGNVEPNDLHFEVMESRFGNVLTTNYDYNLEAAGTKNGGSGEIIVPVKGRKYSLLRRRRAGSTTVWHIHGECQTPASILLGYEQYSGYLQNLRNYFVSGFTYSKLHLDRLLGRIKSGKKEVKTWVDFLFFKDVYILGLALNFTEIHLWWILNYRARLQQQYPNKITNKIVYIFPEIERKAILPQLQLLEGCNVKLKALKLKNKDWKGLYRDALEFTRNDPH